MLKEKFKEVKEKVSKSNLVKLLKSKTIIKELENKIGELGKEKEKLIDANRTLNLEIKRFDKYEKKTTEFKKEIRELDVLLEDTTKELELQKKAKLELESKIFELNHELSKYKIQCEEYEAVIKDYKTEGRYLIKTLKPGRTPNTIKTRVSKPMTGSVVRYMRGEHE